MVYLMLGTEMNPGEEDAMGTDSVVESVPALPESSTTGVPTAVADAVLGDVIPLVFRNEPLLPCEETREINGFGNINMMPAKLFYIARYKARRFVQQQDHNRSSIGLMSKY